MSNGLDVSGIEIQKMEEGDTSGIKLLIKRKYRYSMDIS